MINVEMVVVVVQWCLWWGKEVLVMVIRIVQMAMIFVVVMVERKWW